MCAFLSLLPALVASLSIKHLSLFSIPPPHPIYFLDLEAHLSYLAVTSLLDMDFLLPASASSHSSSSSSLPGGTGRVRYSCVVSEMFGKVACAMISCIFVIVGSAIGAVTGALIGIAAETGLLRGAGIGAISGALFSIEVVESSLNLWNDSESGTWSILLYAMDIISSIFNGRLVREKVGLAVRSAIQSQMSAVNTTITENDLFGTDSMRGLSQDSVERLPKTKISRENSNLNATGEKSCCSVCLQDFQTGETVRILPLCRHIFHLPCIDNWLIRHGSCPLCRGHILESFPL